MEAPQDNELYRQAMSALMLMLGRVYPLAEKSATRQWGAYNDQSNTSLEDKEEFEAAMEQGGLLVSSTEAADGSTHEPEDGAVADYTLYESFWKLQQDLSRPNSVNFSDFLQRLRSLVTTLEHSHVKKSKEPPKQTDDKKEQAFMQDEEMDYADVKNATKKGSFYDQEGYPSPEIRALERCSHRYLTSSRLLSIQLQDGDFRIPILTQVLMVCHHLIQISPVVLKAQLSEWQTRAQALLQAVDAAQLDMLQSILASSEESWRQWKRNKFVPDLDKTESEPLVGRENRKRKLGGTLSSDAIDGDQNDEPASNKISSGAQLKTSCCDMRKSAPTLQVHLHDYVEALDPDAGIEAEYHPRNDAHFSWRAIRLLAAHHLDDIGLVSKRGDFEALVRHVYKTSYNIVIPGEMPPAVTCEEEEAEQEQEGSPAAMGDNDETKETVKMTDTDDDGYQKEEDDLSLEERYEDVFDEKVEMDENEGIVLESAKENPLKLEGPPKHETEERVKAPEDGTGEGHNDEEDGGEDGDEAEGKAMVVDLRTPASKPTASVATSNPNHEAHVDEKPIIIGSHSFTPPASAAATFGPVTKGGFAAMDNKTWTEPPPQADVSSASSSHSRHHDGDGRNSSTNNHRTRNAGDHSAGGNVGEGSSTQQRFSQENSRGGRSDYHHRGSGVGGQDHRNVAVGGSNNRDERHDRGSREDARLTRGGGGFSSTGASSRPPSRGKDERELRGGVGGGGNTERSWHSNEGGGGSGVGRSNSNTRPSDGRRSSDDRVRNPVRGGIDDLYDINNDNRNSRTTLSNRNPKSDESRVRSVVGGGGSNLRGDDRGGGYQDWRGANDRDRGRGHPRHRRDRR